MRIRTAALKFVSSLLSSTLLFGSLAIPGQAQRRAIVINAEQPNVWTLEQAHYLLAQMHRRNLDLKAKRLDELDPNEIAGLRFDVMRMLVEFGATFNQADLASNKIFSRNQEFNTKRREDLVAERDRLRKQSLSLTGEIADLETAKAEAEKEDEKERLNAKIASKKTLLAKVDKEIDNLNGELETLNANAGEQKATTGGAEFDAGKLPKSVFDNAFEDAAADQIEKFNQAPKLNASLRLDNFLQMQYEIIAKQLTLLRDEVGPGERLLFLEMPQTVNAAHDVADKKWAQSWWKIAGYTKRFRTSEPAAAVAQATPRVVDNHEPITTAQDVRSIMRGESIPLRVSSEPTDRASEGNEVNYKNVFFNLDEKPSLPEPVTEADRKWKKYVSSVELTDRMVRTVELIPRQSSLNVNDMKLRTRAGAFNFVLSTLFGFGAQLSVQRQREQFAQFVQQELYSSAFGKGAREFGWTFTPMPGMDRLQSGVRTTYAVVVVPDDATSLVLETNGCYFPRTAYQPKDFEQTRSQDWNVDGRTSRNCSGSRPRAFVVPIPSATIDGGNDFWVDRIWYQPVGKGERIVVLVSGKNFSSQIGVLVNGIPLIHSIGMAQPLMRDDSETGRLTALDFKDTDIPGRIERIDANKIVFSFKMPKDFEGTPAITLVAPGKAIDINWLTNIRINGEFPSTLSDASRDACQQPPAAGCIPIGPKMFMGDPVRPIRIESVEVFRAPNRTVHVLVTGAGFDPVHHLYINGVLAPGAFVSKSLLRASYLPTPADDKIQVTLKAGDKTIKFAVANPTLLKIERVTVVSYEAAQGNKPGVLVVRLEGSGFRSGLRRSPLKIRFDVTSSTEAFVTIPRPNETEVITLTDPVTGLFASTVVARKPPK